MKIKIPSWDQVLTIINFIDTLSGTKARGLKDDDVLKAGFLNLFKWNDEAAFARALVEMGDQEEAKKIRDWVQSDQINGRAFRLMIATLPSIEARVNVLSSYANMSDDDERTKAFKAETIPPKLWTDFKKLLTKKNWEKILEVLPELKPKVEQLVNKVDEACEKTASWLEQKIAERRTTR